MLSTTFARRGFAALAVAVGLLGSVTSAPVTPALAQSAPVSRPAINILCRLSDGVAPSKTAAQVQDMFSDANLGGYFREMSNGSLSIAGTTTVGWKDLGHPRSYYMSSSNTSQDYVTLGRACLAAADAEVDFRSFGSINLFFNTGPGVMSDFSIGSFDLNGLDNVTRSYPIAFLTARALTSPSLIAHEMGHGFGMGHGSGGPEWDPMNAAVLDQPLGPGYNGYHRDVAHWIPANRKVDLSRVPFAVLTQLTQPNSSDAMLASYPLPGGDSYTVEYRRRVGFDASLPDEGVLIYRIHPLASPDAFLQSAGGGTGYENVLWRAGETFSDPANNLRISVLSVGGGVARVLVQSGTVPTPPVNPYVSSTTNTSVSVGWTNTGPSSLTLVRWRANGTTDAWKSQYVLWFYGGALVSNLSPGFNYDVALQSCWGDGWFLCGAETTFTTTTNGIAPAAPSGVAVDAINASGFTLHWADNANNEQRYERQ